MTNANGSRHSMGYIAEVTPGTTPATPAFSAIRHNTTNLALTKTTIQSAELRSDRQIADVRHGNYNVAGDIVSDLSYGSFDDFLQAVFGGTWTANILKGGVTRRSFTIERYFADIGQYLRYRGCEFDKFSMSVKPNAMVTSTFSVIGRDADPAASSIIAGATYGAATVTSAMDSFTGSILENGSPISTITEVSLNIVNGLSPMFVVGQKGAGDISIGRFQVNAQITAYFDSVAILNKFINESESDLEFVTSGSGGTYTWTLPRIKYTGGQPDVGGEGPITLSMPIIGLYDSSSSTTLQVERTPA